MLHKRQLTKEPDCLLHMFVLNPLKHSLIVCSIHDRKRAPREALDRGSSWSIIQKG